MTLLVEDDRSWSIFDGALCEVISEEQCLVIVCTYIFGILHSRLEFGETKVNLDGEDNSPVGLAIGTFLRLCSVGDLR